MKLLLSLPGCVAAVEVCALSLFAEASFFVLPAPAQQGFEGLATEGVQTETDDRLHGKGWWPTKGTFGRSKFAGAQSCSPCHADQAATQPTTPMGLAAERSPNFAVLQQDAVMTMREVPRIFSLESSRQGSRLSVTGDGDTVSVTIQWAFGSSRIRQTYLYSQDGSGYESQVSFYSGIQGLDLTVGHTVHPGATLLEELGKRLEREDALRCFQCHTSFAVTAGNFDPDHATPGLECEMCYGPALEHVRSMSEPSEQGSGTTPGAAGLVLADFDRMSPVDSVDFCGACHRAWADIAFAPTPPHGTDVLRFQPYRLEESKCWGTNDDPRITCVVCHDPHRPLVQRDQAYDHQCLACHRSPLHSGRTVSAARFCPVAGAKCVSCHMPKYKVAGMHGRFTGHWISIVRPGEPLPM